MPHPATHPAILPLILALLALTACAAPPRTADDPYMPDPVEATGQTPDYAQLVERYNDNLEHLDRLWSRAVVSMRWTDEDDRRQFEQGEGHFIYMSPDHVALTVGKVGNVMLWAGSDEQRYWMFDLRDDGIAHHGRHEHVGDPCSRELTLPVQPRAVPHLLGLLPLDESLVGLDPDIEQIDGYHVVEPPGTRLRLTLHPETTLPVRVDLTDDQGQSVVIALLEDHQFMEVEGVARVASPRIPTRATLHAVGEDAELTLNLAGMTDGRRFDTIDERVFDLEFLQQRHTPAELIDLDQACP